jgi:hypothetical protein
MGWALQPSRPVQGCRSCCIVRRAALLGAIAGAPGSDRLILGSRLGGISRSFTML